MNVNCTFKNFEASDHLRKYARKKMEKLGRFFGKSSGIDVNTVLTVDKFRHRCEVTVNGEGLHLNASEQAQDMYAAIDLVSDKIESQIKRQLGRVKEQRRKSRNAEVDVFTYHLDSTEDSPNEETYGQAGSDRFVPKPMPLDEAQILLEARGGEFLVFLNAENNRVNVIYRLENASFALIDPIL